MGRIRADTTGPLGTHWFHSLRENARKMSKTWEMIFFVYVKFEMCVVHPKYMPNRLLKSGLEWDDLECRFGCLQYLKSGLSYRTECDLPGRVHRVKIAEDPKNMKIEGASRGWRATKWDRTSCQREGRETGECGVLEVEGRLFLRKGDWWYCQILLW